MSMKGKPRISGIAAITENRAMGKENGLMFHLPGDLPRFKKITFGHPVIMGRKTFESKEINKRSLPGRLNIVITRDSNYDGNGATVVTSLEQAIQIASNTDQEEIFILGGAQIFTEALPKIDRLYLTMVKGNYEGDVYFPEYLEFTKIIEDIPMKSDNFTYDFLTLER